MYITAAQALTMHICELSTTLQRIIINAVLQSIKYTSPSQQLIKRLSGCRLCEAEEYIPDLFTKYIHII